MAYAKKNINFLKFAKGCLPKQRKAILDTASRDQVLAVCECADNALRGNIKLNTQQKKKLARHKQVIRHLVNKKVNWKAKRKTLSQKGGSLFPALLAPILAALCAK